MKKLLLVLALVGCADDSETIGPDPTGSTGSATAGAGGAGGGSMVGGGYESGSRLKVRTLIGEDGSRQPAGWYDTQLETECSWRTASDGQTRCLPIAIPTIYFADAACMQPIAQLPCQSSPSYIEAMSSQCDQLGPGIFASGSPIADPENVFRLSPVTGECGAMVAPNGGFWISSAGLLGAEGFVSATAEIAQ